MKPNASKRNAIFVGAIAGALAAAPMPSAHAQGIGVQLNGQPINFGGAAPVQVGGRVLVPLRGVFESLGATVSYDQATQTVFANGTDTRMQLRIGTAQAQVNGQTRILDVPAQVRYGRTLVPLRFVSEALGAQVQWNEAQRTVFISTNDVGGNIGGGPVVQNPPVTDNTYYPPNSMPVDSVMTISGTVRRNLPGPRRFEVQADNGVIFNVQTTDDEPANLSQGDRIQMRGRLVEGVFEAEWARLTADTGTRTRLAGTVVTVFSANRLTMRTNAGQTVTVYSTQPLDATITSGDRIRVNGTLEGNFMTANRVVLVTNTGGATGGGTVGQQVDFRGTVESVDTIGQTLQVRGDNGFLYVVRYIDADNFQSGDRVRIVGRASNGVTTASSVTRM